MIQHKTSVGALGAWFSNMFLIPRANSNKALSCQGCVFPQTASASHFLNITPKWPSMVSERLPVRHIAKSYQSKLVKPDPWTTGELQSWAEISRPHLV